MRILRIDSWDGRPGGGQEYVRTTADALEGEGHPQLLIQLVSRDPEHPRPDERFVRVPVAGAGRVGTDLVADGELEREFADALATFQPELVHLHHFDAAFSSLARCLGRLTVPLVFTAHDAEVVCPISTLVRPGGVVCDGGVRLRCLFTGCHVGWGGPYSLWQARVFDSLVAPKVRAFLCPSRRLAQYLDANGYRPAVHLPSFAEIPQVVREAPYPPPPADTPPTVGFLGRIETYKGIDDLVDAVGLLVREIPDLRFDIAGEGSHRRAVEERVRRRGLEPRTTFRGHVSGESKEAWFRNVHVLAVPSSSWENFGFVALEAQVRGRPVVATDFGGLPDIVVDGETGRLVPLSNPPRLAAALRELLSDGRHAAALGLNGRRRVLGNFTPEIHLERLYAVYAAVLGGRKLSSLASAESILREGEGRSLPR